MVKSNRYSDTELAALLTTRKLNKLIEGPLGFKGQQSLSIQWKDDKDPYSAYVRAFRSGSGIETVQTFFFEEKEFEVHFVHGLTKRLY